MMKHAIRKQIWTVIMIFGVLCPHRCYGRTQPPAIAFVEQLLEVGRSDSERERLLQSATFFNDQQAVEQLLDHLHQVDKEDIHHKHKLLMYRVIMTRMTCQPERLIIKRLRTESDAWEKAKLLNVLRDFYTNEVFLALIDQLDDTRKIACAYCGQRRICDLAYEFLLSKLKAFGFIQDRQFESIYGKERDYQAKLIATFK